MKKQNSFSRIAIDTQIFLKYYLDEENSDKIKEILDQIDDENIEAVISSMSLCELYYIIGRSNLALADEIVREMEDFHLLHKSRFWKIVRKKNLFRRSVS